MDNDQPCQPPSPPLFTSKTEHSSWDDLPTSFQSSRKRPYSDRRSEKYAQQTCVDFETKVNEYFDKKFHFKPQEEEWELPKPGNMFSLVKWKDNHLQKLKSQLNSVKNKLNDFNLDDWHRHTRLMNKAGDIQWRLQNEFEPEFVTQAWCKFYENVMSFPLVPKNFVAGDLFVSVHLCEAPGAFITSLNHYLKINRPNVPWDWLATTLNPHYEGNQLSNMINDDRFIMQTLDHWIFGQDTTGNLMCLKNMIHLVEKARARGKVMLVTADGSIDCQGDPGEQESVVSRLHYCEVVTALHILAPGGSFLLKMFTMFECDTICLMYLLCCAFKQVSVNKPTTSKEGNSEVYVVCLEYRGTDFLQPWLGVLRDNYGSDTLRNAMFLSFSLPVDFLEQLENCAEKFTNYQVEVIENNIWTFQHKHENRFVIKRLRHLIALRFIEVYDIRRVECADEIVGRNILKQMGTPNIEPRSSHGSFNDRLKKEELSQLQMLTVLQDEMEALNIQWPFTENIKWLQFPDERTETCIQTGLPVTSVQSSKFCLGKLVNIRNQVKQLVAGNTSCSMASNATELNISESTSKNADTEVNSDFVPQLKQQFPGAVMLDFKASLWTSLEDGRNGVAECSAFHKIKNKINELWRDNTLIMVGYPMLTQFNAGMVYMMGHLFDKVGFVRPVGQDFAVVFKEFRHWDSSMLHFLDQVGKYIDVCQQVGSVAVLAILPINILSGTNLIEGDSLVAEDSNSTIGNGPKGFYSCVVEVNNLCVLEQTADIITTALSSFPNKSTM